MRVVLPSWDGENYSTEMSTLIQKLFTLLGRVLMTCTGMLPFDGKCPYLRPPQLFIVQRKNHDLKIFQNTSKWFETKWNYIPW